MARLTPPKINLRLPLTIRTVGITLAIGMALWLAGDYLGTITIERVINKHIIGMLNDKALTHRLSFNHYVDSHHKLVQIMSTQSAIVRYIENSHWPKSEQTPSIILHTTKPQWVPDNTLLRTFVSPKVMILIDKDGTVREVYSQGGWTPPKTLIDMPSRLLMLSRKESHLTTLGDAPYLVTSEIINVTGDNTGASVLLASPLDSEFLAKSIGVEKKDLIIVLLDSSGNVFVSSKPDRIPKGMSIPSAQERYLIVDQEFLEYGGSELNFRFAALISADGVKALAGPIISQYNIAHISQGVMFLLAFMGIIFFNSRRIKKMTRRVVEFSKNALGGQHIESGKWDEIYILQESFRVLTETIEASNNTIKSEAADIARKEEIIASKEQQLEFLQTITESAGIGVALVIDGNVTPINSMMINYCDNYGEPDCFNLREGTSREMEVEYFDGSRHVFNVVSPKLDLDKKVILATDITEQKKAIEDIVQTKKDWESTFDSITDMITIYDKSFNVIAANTAARAFINLPVFKGDDAGFLKFFHQQDTLEMSPMHDCLHSGKAYTTEMFKSDVDMYFEVQIIPRLSGDGEVSGFIHVARDISIRKGLEGSLKRSAFYDDLTDLPNRALFMDRLENLFLKMRRNDDISFSILFIDLDDFKKVNDSLGHAIGDKLLKEVSERLLECIRPGDTVSRFGGDEYVIILNDIHNERDAVDIADRMRKSIKQQYVIDDNTIHISSSIGIALRHSEYLDKDDILRDADTAMYHAKARGRDCYMVFDDHMHFKAVENLNIENDLRKALENDEFVLYFQPIVNIRDYTIAGYEALLRWNHPIRGFVLPDTFIHIAEHSGLIIEIGKWVLKEACGQLNAMQCFDGSKSPYVTVNISPRQLNEDLPDIVRDCIINAEILPESLRLEITESLLMQNPELALNLIQRLRNMNIQVYLDDFGTGYSSLNYIHKFPIDAIKVDRSFVTNITDDKEAREIVRAIVMLAQNLGIKTIIEGVELEEQLEVFKELNCDLVQGFLFSRPVSGDNLFNHSIALIKD